MAADLYSSGMNRARSSVEVRQTDAIGFETPAGNIFTVLGETSPTSFAMRWLRAPANESDPFEEVAKLHFHIHSRAEILGAFVTVARELARRVAPARFPSVVNQRNRETAAAIA